MTFVLDLPLDIAVSRRKPRPDRMETRGEEYYGRVRGGFLKEAKRRPDRIRVIDATGSVESIAAEIRGASEPWLWRQAY
jgi:dTMP kinase